MYRKNKNNWVKHLDFMILDLICLQVAFFLAYTLRHRTVNLYTNYIYANLSIVLILIDVCLLIFLNTLKNVLKRGYLVEFIATIKHVAIVELVAVLYLFSVKDAGDFSRISGLPKRKPSKRLLRPLPICLDIYFVLNILPCDCANRTVGALIRSFPLRQTRTRSDGVPGRPTDRRNC